MRQPASWKSKFDTFRHPIPVELAQESNQTLNEHQLALADQLGRRLHAELRAVLALLPAADLGGSALSRLLVIDRATCQRVIGAVSGAEAGPQTLVRLPGVEGLRQFLAAVARVSDMGDASEKLAAASAAIDRFEAALAELGGSQRRLKERLEAGAGADISADLPHPACDDERSREALFRAAANVTGRWSDATISLAIIRPTDADPLLTEAVRVHGLIGHRWHEQSLPLEVGQTASQRASGQGPAFATLDTTPARGDSPGSLLEEFCSTPPPRVVSRVIEARTVHVIDADPAVTPPPIDVVTAHRSASPDRHPATLRPAVGEVWALQHVAARALVFDTFLHRDIARRCIPSLEVHLWTPDVIRPGAARWSTRFPGGPRLTLLGQGLRAVGTTVYPRFGDLARSVFSRVGWNVDEFVGFRCEVAFPLWRAGYCMSFDFTGAEVEQSVG